MADKEISIDDIAMSIAELAEAVAKGFERVEGQLKLLNDRVGVLEAQHKEVVTRIEQIPDTIDQTYGEMLNGHEDRIRALERS
jgi:hypothetical protein